MSDSIAIDIGNTNTVFGVFRGDELIGQWRVQTSARRTGDEYALLLRQLCDIKGLDPKDIGSGIVASVVPPATGAVVALFEEHLGVPCHVVGPGTKSGMRILYDNPREVGADRIVNAVAALAGFPQGCIVVDFGTATTWDVVSPKAEYLGGLIAPGIHISAEALYQRAAKLPRVEVAKPATVVGRNTTTSMQAGIYYGYVGMVDAVVARIKGSIDFSPAVVATGGYASLIAEDAESIEKVDEMLTLKGLRILLRRNS